MELPSSFPRRSLLFAAFAASSLKAQPASPEPALRDVLTSMATSLSAGNSSAFMKSIAAAYENRQDLAVHIQSLINSGEISSSVSLQYTSGGESKQTARVDWYLAVSNRVSNINISQRREILEVVFAKEGKRWRVMGITPADFFRPA
jgi:hypothetical protein